ncbi:MAG TPA: hypothetical protein VMX13_02210 [Sedimentisphaerales bacterium]|jgi:hypothetical protein|nr:hypothetical protein [Sedimentisphaerales bacterium]
MNDDLIFRIFRHLIFLFVIPGLITAVVAYLLFRYRRHLFEMVCSIGFLTGLFSFCIEPQGSLPGAVVMAAGIIALAAVKIVHRT